MAYTAYLLKESTRNHILRAFPPKFPDVVCHHVTIEFGVNPDKTTLPPAADLRIVGYAADESLECLVVQVSGRLFRKDKGIYHITLSLDKSKGRKPVDSNRVLTGGWETVGPYLIDTEPALIAH